jgi:hypothetical protein
MTDGATHGLRRREVALPAVDGTSADVTPTERPSQLARARRRTEESGASRLAQARRQVASRST